MGDVETKASPGTVLLAALLVTFILIMIFAWPVMAILGWFGVVLGYWQVVLILATLRGVWHVTTGRIK